MRRFVQQSATQPQHHVQRIPQGTNTCRRCGVSAVATTGVATGASPVATVRVPYSSDQWLQETSALQQQQQQQQTPSQRRAGTTFNSSSRSHKLDEVLQLLRSRPAVANPALLTAAIKATSSWQQAAAVFTEHSHAFNHIHTAAFISHMPKVLLRSSLPPTPRQQSDMRLLLEDVTQLAEELLHHCSDRELANIAHGLASLRFYNRRLMQLLLCRCKLQNLKPQELSNLTWAIAKLGHEVHEGWVQDVLDLSLSIMQRGSAAAAAANTAGQGGWTAAYTTQQQQQYYAHAYDGKPQPQPLGMQLQQQHEGFKLQEICNIAWGLAVMQRRCLLHSAPPLRHRCTIVSAAWKQQLCTAVAAQIRQCSAADVSMCLWALAVLGHSQLQQSWIDLMLLRAAEVAGTMQGRHIAVVLWATGRLQRGTQQQQQQPCSAGIAASSGSSSVQRFGDVCFPVLQRLLQQQQFHTPQQQQQRGQLQLVCVALLSCGHLGLRPSAAVIAAILSAAAQNLQAWALQQHLQQQHGLESHDSTSSSSSSSSSSDVWHQWSNMAAASQQALQVQRHRQQQAIVHDVSTVLHSLVELSFHPGQKFISVATAAVAAAVWQQVRAAAAARQRDKQHAGSTAAAPVAAGVQGRQLAMLLWSMAKLQIQPSRKFLWLLRAAASDQLQTFSSRDVAVMLWALGQMHDAPQFTWVRRMLQHFLARLDDSVHTAPDVCQALNALPKLPSVGAHNLHRVMLHELSDMLPQLAAAAAARFDECKPRELVGMIQGFARLGYWPGLEWQQQHWQQCSLLQQRGVAFSEREQQILEQSRDVLLQLGQQQQNQQEFVQQRQLQGPGQVHAEQLQPYSVRSQPQIVVQAVNKRQLVAA